MSRITATWNPERGEETKVTFSQDFESLSRIEVLDFLQDTIGELTDKYNTALRDGKNGI